MSSGFNVGFSSVASVIVGGDLGDLVSATPFATRAALDATSAEDGKLALLETPTSGEPRLFVRSGGAWVAAGERLWEVATTGVGVYDALLTAAGEAVYDGDLGIDGNGTVYVFVVDASRRAAIIPRNLTGGIVVGETHTASLVAHWYKEDPSTATDVSLVDTPGSASITYNSGTGATTLQTTVSDYAQILLGTTAVDADVVYQALLGATWTGNRTAGNGTFVSLIGTSNPYTELSVRPAPGGDYFFQTTSTPATINGADPYVEHDIVASWDGTTARGYYNSPGPAQDDAVPAPDGSTTNVRTRSTASFLTAIAANPDASTPSLVCDGAYTITLTAI
jgi:hypothetical protein